MPKTVTTLQFLEENGNTKLISITTFENEQALKTVLETGMLEGITQTWDKLEAFVQ